MTRRLAHLRAGAAREEGWALTTAIILLAVLLALGMASLTIVDTQSRQSAITRQKDTAFNLAEAAMALEVVALNPPQWPGANSSPYPTCTQSTSDSRCPSPTVLLDQFAGSADLSGATWRVNVYDNGAPSATAYTDGVTSSQPAYDANGDGTVWIRAQATVGGRSRTLVERVQVQQYTEPMPRDVIVAGSLQISNSGNKVLIDTQGSAFQPSPVYVRCVVGAAGCLQYRTGQISPDTTSGSYTGAASLSSTSLARLKARAQADGTYYATCPSSLPATSTVIWIDSGDCSYTGTDAPATGALIINSGTLYLGGTVALSGVVYAVNAQASAGPVVQVQGHASITGGIYVDGNGGIVAGSSKLNVTFDPNAFGRVQSYLNSATVLGSFQELPPA